MFYFCSLSSLPPSISFFLICFIFFPFSLLSSLYSLFYLLSYPSLLSLSSPLFHLFHLPSSLSSHLISYLSPLSSFIPSLSLLRSFFSPTHLLSFRLTLISLSLSHRSRVGEGDTDRGHNTSLVRTRRANIIWIPNVFFFHWNLQFLFSKSEYLNSDPTIYVYFSLSFSFPLFPPSFWVFLFSSILFSSLLFSSLLFTFYFFLFIFYILLFLVDFSTLYLLLLLFSILTNLGICGFESRPNIGEGGNRKIW